jgi:hypothetical protein
MRNLSDTQKAAHLLAMPTITDSAWTNEQRLPGEDRPAFIARVLKVRCKVHRLEAAGIEPASSPHG